MSQTRYSVHSVKKTPLLEDFLQLLHLCVALEQRPTREQRQESNSRESFTSTASSSPQQEELSEDAADAPHVHREHVDRVEQHLRSSVPQRHHLNTAGAIRLLRQSRADASRGLTYAWSQSDVEAVDARQAEVCDLHLSAAAHQDVLRLQVAVHHQVCVQKFQPPQHLLHYILKQQSLSSCLNAKTWIFIYKKQHKCTSEKLKGRF